MHELKSGEKMNRFQIEMLAATTALSSQPQKWWQQQQQQRFKCNFIYRVHTVSLQAFRFFSLIRSFDFLNLLLNSDAVVFMDYDGLQVSGAKKQSEKKYKIIKLVVHGVAWLFGRV